MFVLLLTKYLQVQSCWSTNLQTTTH